MAHSRNTQRGAALIMVLLLVATLSFLLIALNSVITQSARRSAGSMLRAELLWRLTSAEVIAATAIEEAFNAASQGGPPLAFSHPLFSQQWSVPVSEGAGAIIFADATRCFNVNSLGTAQNTSGQRGDSQIKSSASTEFTLLLTTLGMTGTEAESLAAVITDWIDEDPVQEIGGAEDGFYAGLPIPYHTGGGPVGSVSELRAMKGVTSVLYDGVSPYLCAIPDAALTPINVNALRPSDAPLLTAASGGLLDPSDAARLIEDRPPGGWTSVDQFLASPAFRGRQESTQSMSERLTVSPLYIEAAIGASLNSFDMNARLMFSTSDPQNVRLISRTLGAAG